MILTKEQAGSVYEGSDCQAGSWMASKVATAFRATIYIRYEMLSLLQVAFVLMLALALHGGTGWAHTGTRGRFLSTVNIDKRQGVWICVGLGQSKCSPSDDAIGSRDGLVADVRHILLS